MSTALILPEDYWIWTPGMPIDIKRFPKHVRDIIQQIQDHTRSYFFPFPGFGGFRRKVFITIGSNQTDLNLATFGGSLVSTAADYVYTNAGQTISASSTGAYACRTGSFPAGSTLKLINNGNIWGAGGNGGGGGGATPGPTAAVAGSAGGPAMLLEFALILDNGSGNVFGGGGGGGGGGRGRTTTLIIGGGGGGGGRGSITSSGAAGGLGANGGPGGGTGNNGGSGSAGTGGAGGVSGGSAGNGGTGGDWGAVGSTGGNASGFPVENSPGASGGAAGAAIAQNGFSLNIIAGNNGSQIKGSVG